MVQMDPSSFFLFFSAMFGGPSGDGIAKTFEAENNLLTTLFRDYDSKPPPIPIEIMPNMRVNHVESIDEEQQTMTIYATFKIHWRDPRLIWEPKDYNYISEITKPWSFFRERAHNLTAPTLYINHIGVYGSRLLRHDVEVGIKSDGTVTMLTNNHIKSTCYFSFGLYPNDFQNCSFQLFSAKYADELRFSPKSLAIVGTGEETETVHVNDFQLAYIEPNGGYLKNRKFMDKLVGPPRASLPIFNFNLVYKRVKTLYFVEMAVPVLCQTLFVGISGIAKGFTGLMWLMICLIYEVFSMTEIFDNLPPDYNEIPLIGMIGIFLLFETVGLMFWRTFTINIRSMKFEKLEECEDGTVINPYLEIAEIGDGIITVLLIVQMFMNTIVLF